MTADYKCEFYKDMKQYIKSYTLGDFCMTPEKYIYTTGLMKEFSLEFMMGNTNDYGDGEMILQDKMSNDLLKFKFLDDRLNIYLGSTKLNETPLKNNHFFYLIYENNKLYGYYNLTDFAYLTGYDFGKDKTTKIFSVDIKLNLYQIEFNHKAPYNGRDREWNMWLLRISRKANDLYYAK